MTKLLLSGLLVLVGVSEVSAQALVRLAATRQSDVLSSNGDSFTVAVGGYGSLRLQTLDTYSGTWEVQCSADGGTTFDDDDEVNLNLEGFSGAAVTSVVDTVGIWTAGVAGCTHVKIVATAGFAATDTTVSVVAVSSGGSAAGSGGAVTVTSGSISCTNCTGSGASNTEDNPALNADPLAPAGAIRKATPANTSGLDGDYEVLQMNNGRLYTSATIDAALPAGSNAIGTVTVTDGAGALNTIIDSGSVTVSDGAGALNTIIDSGTLTAVTTITNTVNVAGVKTNNSAVPGATNIGALTALANAAAPTYTEGNMVALSTDLSGAVRVTGSSGTTQYAEDTAHVTGHSIVALGAIRSDTTPTSTANLAGDYALPNVDANGRLYTNAVLYTAAGAAFTPATDVTEEAAETPGGSGPFIMSVRRDTAASSAGVTGRNASVNTDSIGRLWTSGAVVEDVAETVADVLVAAGTVRRDTAASSAGASGDNATLNTDGLGRLWVRSGSPCQDHARISTVAINTAASGSVEMVALNGSDLIYICGYSIVAGAATAVKFRYGTGAACVTGPTDLTGAWSFAANGGIQQPNTGAPQFVVPAGQALCTNNSGANSIQGHITYVRTAAP